MCGDKSESESVAVAVALAAALLFFSLLSFIMHNNDYDSLTNKTNKI